MKYIYDILSNYFFQLFFSLIAIILTLLFLKLDQLNYLLALALVMFHTIKIMLILILIEIFNIWTKFKPIVYFQILICLLSFIVDLTQLNASNKNIFYSYFASIPVLLTTLLFQTNYFKELNNSKHNEKRQF